MAKIEELHGIPTRAKAERIAADLPRLFPDRAVTVIGDAPPCTVRSEPCGAGASAAPAPHPAKRTGIPGFPDFIAVHESRGNYNAWYGAAGNTDHPRFTSMTLAEGQAWQEGRKFGAGGKQQIIRDTLRSLRERLALPDDAPCDEDMQDRLASVLREGRGLRAYLSGTLPREDFALSVAREWAALPGVKPPFGERSVYAGDG